MWLQAFENWLLKERHSPNNTVKAYLRDVQQFLEFTKAIFDKDAPHEVEQQEVKSWLVSLLEEGKSVVSVKRKQSALNTYYQFLKVEEAVDENPVKDVQTPKKPERLVDFIEEDSLNTLFEKVDFGQDPYGRQDYIILETLYGTGIRLSELIGLKIGDVKKDALKVTGKGNKERQVPLHSMLSKLLREQIEMRQKANEAGMRAPLFVTKKGKLLYPMYVYRLVNKALAKVSTVSKKSPHQLRHSFATHLLNKGVDINAIKELLGHESLAATQIYTHNSIEKLKGIYKKSHPKGE